MPKLCFYFQLHQPYRLADYTIFDLSNSRSYFVDEHDTNKAVFQKVAQKSYLPMLSLLLKLLQKHPEFTFTLSCSGVFLEQAESFEPKVIQLLKKIVKTGRVELLAETYYHSLAALYSPGEFKQQVYLHLQKIHDLFGVKPRVFRNTELVYSNDIAALVTEMRFEGMLTEAVSRYLHGRPKTQVYADITSKLPLLLKHAELSDDIAFRFSDKNWHEHPLTVDKYLRWLADYDEHQVINLFMDFETFGEHQWADTGIFDFFAALVEQFGQSPWNRFVTPSQVVNQYSKQARLLDELPTYDVPIPISWADVDRDLTAWIDNPLQQDTIGKIYGLEQAVLTSKDKQLIDDWRKLQTSDHFYYMCTKWSADGDVHAYFSPYDSPFEAYRRFSIVLADLIERVR
jgi:alpha-amylase